MIIRSFKSLGGRSRALAAVSALAAATLVAGCAYNETLGRNQIVLMDDSALMQASQAAWNETLRTQKVSNDRALNDRVTRVGNRVATAAQLQNRNWTYAVFESATPNAFVLPSGHMGVTTGLLSMVRNDDQLAAVIGHEVAHVVGRHAAERSSTSSLTQLALGAIQNGAGEYGQAVGAFGGMAHNWASCCRSLASTNWKLTVLASTTWCRLAIAPTNLSRCGATWRQQRIALAVRNSLRPTLRTRLALPLWRPILPSEATD